MASIKFGFGVDEVIGSIGGTTFQRGHSGFIVRSKPRPRNPRSVLQSNNRQIWAALSQRWRTLSDADRTSWDAVAPNWPKSNRHGDPVVLSGYDVYMLANTGLVFANGAPSDTGVNPAVLWVPGLPSMVISIAAGTAIWSWTNGNVPADFLINLRTSRLLSPGRAYRASGIRYAVDEPAGFAPGSDVLSFLTAIWGQPPILGARVWFEMTVYSTLSGNQSAPVPFTCIVVA